MIEKLKNAALFSDMPEEDLRQITDISREKRFLSGDIVVREGTIADTFYLLLEGRVEITKKLEDGENAVLDVLSEGDFFGEMALLDRGTRSANARALQTTLALEIRSDNFDSLLKRNPTVAFQLLKQVSGRLRETGSLLIAHLTRKNEQLFKAYIGTVTALVNTLEARDPYTRGHTDRVTTIAKAIAKRMNFVKEDLAALEIGALLHDVGKIGIPDSILHKPGPLEQSEFEQIKRHPGTGEGILKNIAFLEGAIPSVLYHHERYDGKGYPEKKSGHQIPLMGRVIAVADSFDAMTSDRPYHTKMSDEEAVDELKKGSGTQFDPAVVESFIEVWKSGELTSLRARE